MSLQFILGKASDDHFQKIVDLLQQNNSRASHEAGFYIVPNNVKFESELATLKQLNANHNETYAQSQIQIFSFSRLIWYFLNGSPDYQRPQLSQTAINMIIYQIIEDHEELLSIYRGEGKQVGFIQQLAQQISELQQGNISPDDLDRLAELPGNQLNPELRSKFQDISLIYREFVKQTDGKYLYNSAGFEILNQVLLEMDAAELDHMHFYFSNFEKFSAQELLIIQTLIIRSHVTMDIILDHKYDQEMPTESDFFYQSGKLYYYLYQYAQGKTKVYQDLFAEPRAINAGLKELEDYWIASSQVGKSIVPATGENVALEITETTTPFAELMQVAIKIRQLVAQKGYRYSDFSVLTRHLDQYQDIVGPIFSMQKIPYFTDIQKQMDNHPLVELLDALFSIYRPNRAQNYGYDAMMRLLKTELLIPKDADDNYLSLSEFRRDLALCENLVLKNGYTGKRWIQDEDWMYATAIDNETGVIVDKNQEISAQINVIRNFVKQILPSFYRKLNRAQTGKDAALILYQFLEQNGIAAQLEQWQRQATEAGNLQEAGQAEQVWTQFCSILDDYVTVLGEHEFVMDDFLSLLKAGFTGATYSQIPSTLDQVAISEIGRIQLPDKKITFIIGADDRNMPAKIDNNSLFNDADRDQMADHLELDQYLVDTSELQMVGEPYEDYLRFMTASDHLYFSYNLGGTGDSEIKQISPYVKRIQDHFALPLKKVSDTPRYYEQDLKNYVGSKRTTLKYLIQAALDAKKQSVALSEAWKFVQDSLENDPDQYLQTLVKNLLGSLNYRNQPVELMPEIVADLYGNNLTTSISKLEEFYQDPYEYFLKYGLKLRERDEFEISPANTGQFYHEALDKLIKEVEQQQLKLGELTDSDIADLVDEVTSKIIEADVNYQYEILKSSKRMGYITNQLVNTIRQMALTLNRQSQHVKMRPQKTELTFGPGQSYAPLQFQLDDQHQVNVQGRIDRIDALQVKGTDYLGIVDYKSGDKDIDLAQIYDGTAMQMMTYLDAVLKNIKALSDERQAELAGALYLHIFNPLLKPKDVVNWHDETQINQALMKEHKYKGLLVSDTDLLDEIGDGDANLIYPFKFKKDGTLTKNSKTITRENLQRMLMHTENLIQAAAKRIFAGDIDLHPAKYGYRSQIQYSPYKPIMQFDPMLKENNYREINKLSDDDIFENLRKEAEKDGKRMD
ncbi:PD-(D/E)XK nuclease family protein [Fructilactobacillus vespulae]|uniref:PD-(D/E)XK nuclease family protein n=1 Tax=Fructilactobacillus vespulae TaxID=1249630 RepID=UPI0039B608CF